MADEETAVTSGEEVQALANNAVAEAVETNTDIEGHRSKAKDNAAAAAAEVYFDDEEEDYSHLDDALADAIAMEDKMAGLILDGVHLQELIDIDLAAVVLDCGSANWSVGFGGEDSPRSIFPSVLGRPRRRKRLGSSAGAAVAAEVAGNTALEEVCYLGDELEKQDNPDSLVAENPLRHGRVKNWDDMEMVHRIYSNIVLQLWRRNMMLANTVSGMVVET